MAEVEVVTCTQKALASALTLFPVYYNRISEHPSIQQQ
jgi:hypothetical protein